MNASKVPISRTAMRQKSPSLQLRTLIPDAKVCRMNSPRIFLLASALFFVGCATQSKEQMAVVRSAGVAPATVERLDRGSSLSPDDLIELRRKRVNDAVALRQLDLAGVDYVVDKDIIKRLRKAGVSETVIQAAANAGERFEERYTRPHVSTYYSYGYPYPGYPYDPLYYPYYRPYPSSYGYHSRPYQSRSHSGPGFLPHHRILFR